MPVIQKRDVIVTVRLDKDTYNRLTNYAHSNWITRSLAIHKILMKTLRDEEKGEQHECNEID